jgi:hypothetical protein
VSVEERVAALREAFKLRAASKPALTVHPYESGVGFQVRLTRGEREVIDLHVSGRRAYTNTGSLEWEVWQGPEGESLELLAPKQLRDADFERGFCYKQPQEQRWTCFQDANWMAERLLRHMAELEEAKEDEF